MKIARVIGRVVSERKIESLDGKILLLLQPLDESRESAGLPLVAVDTVRAGEGDTVMYEGGKEAAMSMADWFSPVDAAVIGIVDRLKVGD